jgi:hypothetical protein
MSTSTASTLKPVLDKIKAACQDLIKPEDMPKFLEGLSDEWHHLNFDEPTVYNLPEASQDIRKLYSGQSIHSKHYSKVVSERQPSRSLYDGKAYDVIIVEGIYAMDPDFLKSLKGLPPGEGLSSMAMPSRSSCAESSEIARLPRLIPSSPSTFISSTSLKLISKQFFLVGKKRMLS